MLRSRHAQSMANQHGGIVGGRDVKTLLTEHGEAQVGHVP